MGEKTTVNPKAPFMVKVDPLIAPLLPDYLRNRDGDEDRLRELLAAGDFAAVRKIGHNIRGSAGAYGLPPLTEIGGRIEDAALEKDAAKIQQALNDMRLFLYMVKQSQAR